MKQGTLVAAGATVGGYRLVRLLGRGGMSEVWEAVHGTLDAGEMDEAEWLKWLRGHGNVFGFREQKAK